MPFINDRLAMSQQALDQKRQTKKYPRQSRFRFDPDEVMALLKTRIIGQDQILSELENMLYLVKADFGVSKKPLAVNFLLGPTGVGKTETVNIIAESILGDRDKCCRIDMNTLAQEHYAAALTGSPPGYVGSKEGYTLFDSEKIKGDFSHPGIVLLDEIEKASNDVIRSLLNVLDSGVLILPGSNKTIDFSNAMIFMTSNIGASELSNYRGGIGKGWKKWLDLGKANENNIIQKAIRSKFDPEFLNRIDRILYYRSLGSEFISHIIDAELEKLNQRLISKEITLSLDVSAKHKLHSFYNEEYGARNITRQFRVVIEPVLAKAFISNGEADDFIIQYKDNKFIAIHSIS